jgi:small subunit ribosomal protein S9
MTDDEDDRETREPAGEGSAEDASQAETSAEAQPEAGGEQPGAPPEEEPGSTGGQPSEVTAEERPAPEAPEKAQEASAQAPPEAARRAGEVAGQEAAADSAASAQEPPAGGPGDEDEGGEEEESAPRAKPAVPGAHLEVDIVPEGVDPLGRGEEYEDVYAVEEVEREQPEDGEEPEQAGTLSEPIATAAIDLAAGARYRATGKRKTAVARVTLRPGSGAYQINGRALEVHFPRPTLQRNVRQPLETVGYQERMDVIARLAGGGISAQAGALRHGVSRALLEADPNLRGELKRRGFLTRDSRVKERKKAGLKKARKRPQFSKR